MTAHEGTTGLGVAICTFNSIRTIGRTLESIAGLAERIVVVDSGSTDGTVDLCISMGARVIHQQWLGYVGQKQFAIDQCSACRWTLLLDSDESVEAALRQSITEAIHADGPVSGWYINRKIWFLDGWLHHTFQPEWRLRLFRSGMGKVAGVDPHDRIEVSGATGKLEGDLRHDSWADLSDMNARQLRYAQVSAQQAASGGSIASILLSPPAALLKQLLIKRGFLDGWRGIVAAGMTANATMLKHLFIAAHRHIQREGSRP